MNSKIQWIKRMACGHRNRQRFHNAIYFHLADLDLYPDSLKSTHTKPGRAVQSKSDPIQVRSREGGQIRTVGIVLA
jgi:hypothetical protein